jgi:hypothetical protein
MRKALTVGLATLALLVVPVAAFAEVDTAAVTAVTGVVDDIQDTALAVIPILLAAILAVGLTLWGIRFAMRKFGVRTSG